MLLPDGSVYDAVLDKVFDQAFYQDFFGAVAHVTYSRTEVLRRIVDSGHWGPWDASATCEGCTV